MYHVVYVSTAAKLMTPADLHDLLVQCRRNNLALEVTGALLYRDGTFMQVLEGDEGTVRGLYATIATDPRHADVTFMIDGEADRQFTDWSMAFRDLSVDSGRLSQGFAQFKLDSDVTTAPTRAERLLNSFRRTLPPR